MSITSSNTSNISITSSIPSVEAMDAYGHIQGTNGVYKYQSIVMAGLNTVFTITLSKNSVDKIYYLRVTGPPAFQP